MRTLLFPFLAVLNIVVAKFTDEELVALKSNFLNSGIDRSFNPCQDFPRYAGNSFREMLEKKGIERHKLVYAAKVIESRQGNDIAPIKQVRDFYDRCKSNDSYLKIDRRTFPGDTKQEADQNFQILSDYYSKHQFQDEDRFNEMYIKIISWMFKYGLDKFWAHLGHVIYWRRPYVLDEEKEESCYDVLPPNKYSSLCDTIAGRIFGITGFNPGFMKVYYPRTDKQREKLIEYFLRELREFSLGAYQSCAEAVVDMFPMYYKYMLLDYEFPPPKGQEEIDHKILEYMTAVVENYEAIYRYLNVSEAEKQRQYNYVRNQLKFERFGHPIFEANTFARYFGNIDFNMPYRRRHTHNILPLVRYNMDKKTNMFWTPSLDKHTEEMKDGEHVYIGFGWEAVTWPFYANVFQPSLVFSNFVFAFQNPAVSQIIYATYAKHNAQFVRNSRVTGEVLDTLSDDQIYFINLAQTLLIQKSKRNPGHVFDGNDRMWQLFKCLRPFSNAFRCAKGSPYHQEDECKVLQGNIFPNYNLSYYGHDAVQRFMA